MKTNKSRKRLCSALLCLILTVSMLPITGYAGEGEDEATGGSAVQYPIEINEDNFPDENFRQYVSENIDQADASGNKDKKLSQAEIESVTEIDVNYKNIASLKGIEYFTNLKELKCSGNYLVELDVSTLTNLESLNCADNPEIESLDVSYNKK